MKRRSEILATVARELTALRAERGIDFADAARGAAVGEERLAAAEHAEGGLTPDELERLAAWYGVDVTRFFGGRMTPLSYIAGA
ncbi:MAG: hypothetical protein ABR591_04230 [Candidatus Velthaea sp.]